MSNQIERPNYIITGTFVGSAPAEQRGQYTIRKFAVDNSYYDRSGNLVEQIYALEMFGDNSTQLDNFKKGDKVLVRFNLRASKDKQTGKWRWINLSPWKIEMVEEATDQSQPVVAVPVSAAPVAEVEDPDDLPF